MVNPFKDIAFKIGTERTALLICIGIAFLIWFFLKLSKEYETDRKIHLEYTLPPMMEFTAPPPSTLVATLQGTGGELVKKYVLQRNPAISIDLGQFPEPDAQRNELIWQIQAETGLSVKKINRSYLSFSLDSTATKKVPIELDMELVFEKDFFEYQPIRQSHDSVLLAGPMQELQNVTSVRTQRTVCEPIRGNKKMTLALVKEGFKNTVLQPKEIAVEIFTEQYTEKSLEVPIAVLNAPADYQILPTTVIVSCTVGISKYEELVSDSFSVEVDLGQASEFSEEISIPVNIKRSPNWIKSARISPKTVNFFSTK